MAYFPFSSRKTGAAANRHRTGQSASPISSDWSFCEYYVPDAQAAVSAKPTHRGLFGCLHRHKPSAFLIKSFSFKGLEEAPKGAGTG
jgi:hypothetical protein